MAWIFYDAAVVAILVVCFLICWHKGLVSSLVGLAAVAASCVAAYVLSGMAAPLVYSALFKEKVEQAIGAAMPGTAGGVEWIDRIIEQTSSGAAQNGLSAAETAIEGAVRVILGIIIFTLVSVLLSIAAKAFRKINDVPLLGTLNRLCGGVLGIVIGVFIALLGATVCAVIVAVSGNSLTWLNVDIVDKTYLFSVLYRYNLLVFI